MSSLQLNNDALAVPAVAGLIEFSGGLFVATPSGVLRGLLPTEQYYRLNSDLVGANVNTAQSLFGVGVTLAANTVYEFEGSFILTKSAGATSHNISLGFAGSATLNNISCDAQGMFVGSALPGTTNNSLYGALTNSSAAVVIVSAIAQAVDSVGVLIKGSVSINAGGTFIPQYTLSAAPGGAYSTSAGSFFKIKPIGAAGANTSIGAWA